MTSLADWFDSRTGYRRLMREVLLEPIPGGARWRYVWGSTLVFTFAVQVITGLFLWTAYSPSAQTAWESVYFIQDVMSYGWLLRGIHHYSAQAMVVLMALHLIQVIVDGAYRAPREINFWLGLILMQIVFGLALTGYLLPWDQKGYYATQVSTEIMGAAPVVGPLLQQLVQGGARYGHHTLTRFFAMHAGFLPAALTLFLVLHVYMFRRHGLTVRRPNDRPETTFWPDQVLRDSVACLGVLAVVLLCVFFKGADLSAGRPVGAVFCGPARVVFLVLVPLPQVSTGRTLRAGLRGDLCSDRHSGRVRPDAAGRPLESGPRIQRFFCVRADGRNRRADRTGDLRRSPQRRFSTGRERGRSGGRAGCRTGSASGDDSGCRRGDALAGRPALSRSENLCRQLLELSPL